MPVILPSNRVFAGDESGDVSFAFAQGASRYFVVALMGVSDPDGLRAALSEFRQRNSLSAHYEFSFHRLAGLRLRNKVFEFLAAQNFQVWTIVVDKPSLPDTFRAMGRLDFYVYFVTDLIRSISGNERGGSTLILDEFDRSGKAINNLRRNLRVHSITPRFKKVTTQRSKSEDLLQIADLVAGATYRKVFVGEEELYAKIAGKYRLLYEFNLKKTRPASSISKRLNRPPQQATLHGASKAFRLSGLVKV